jgi:hypothetical protein
MIATGEKERQERAVRVQEREAEKEEGGLYLCCSLAAYS